MDAAPRRIGMLAPMRPELKPLVRRLGAQPVPAGPPDVFTATIGTTECVVTVTGMGTAAAAAAAERLLATGPIDHMVIAGIAGGVSADVRIGDLVVPELVIDARSGTEHLTAPLGTAARAGTIVVSDDLLLADDLAARYGDRDVLAIEMESSGVAAFCEPRGIPWTVFRGISDHLNDHSVDHQILGLAKPDGTANVSALLRFLVTKPWQVPRLARLGKGMNLAANRAANAAVDACTVDA